METTPPTLETSARQAVRIPLDKIEVGQLNMRSQMDPAELSELALSMSRIGQYAPISVFQTATGYELIMGHRRCAAAELLKWTHVDGFIESRDDPTLWSMAWSENHDRAGVAPSDQAEYLDKMRSINGWSQEQLAGVTGMSKTQISDLLAILLYPEPLREALDAGAIPMGVARTLFRIEDAAVMIFYLAQACEYGCTARTAEEWVRNYRLSQMTTPGDGEEPTLEPPAPTNFQPGLHTCPACLNTTDRGVIPVYVCTSCAATIVNPGS